MADSSKTVRKTSNRALTENLRTQYICRKINIPAIIIIFNLIIYLFCLSESAFCNEFRSPRGSTAGFFTPDPVWSLGLQVASDGLTGITAQRLGVMSGAIDGTLGIFDGPSISVDYIRFFDSEFNTLVFSERGSYKPLRGNLRLTLGGGLRLGGGIAFRIPMGITYCMLKDPIQLFAGINIMAGQVYSDKVGVGVGIQFGFRMLL